MRKILLTLAADATECGACCHATNAPRGSGWFCDVFGEPMDWDGRDTKRLPECISAEQRAGRMVEISREDCAIINETPQPDSDFGAFCDALGRVNDALREHGRKA